MAHLLIVEDNELVRDALQAQLGQAGYTVTTANDGLQAQSILQTQRFDAVVLDLGLPGVDGLEVLRWVRQRLAALPVLILTARDELNDRVLGLNDGADDYMTKPFDLAELQARLQAMLRRARLPAFNGNLHVRTPNAANLRLDPDKPLAWLDDKTLDVTHREWSLLRLLVDNLGQVVSRDDVLGVWQTVPMEGGTNNSNALEVYIHRLRRKLHDSGFNIRNVRGLGYLLEITG